MPIQILPDEVASQIAAGEVVERPASAVKELVENALDAGATSIRIIIEGAGLRRIQIEDDGTGIPPEELALAVTRHATSKLRQAEDLFCVNTLGFRGEALASIASVSRLSITTRPKESEAGARMLVEGGRLNPLKKTGAPFGTAISVEDLFFNVPARRKFLKKDVTERRLIDEMVTRYAIAYPNVRFSLMQEGRPALQTTGNGDRREILASFYGVDIARQLLEVIALEGNIRIGGFISPISLTRSNRKDITFFVNGRPVQDTTLTTALLLAYRTLLMVGRYPLAVIFLELPPEAVDVNVHPTKAEVRFRDRDLLFSAVQRAARRALLAYTPVPQLHSPYQSNFNTDSLDSSQPSSSWDWSLPDSGSISQTPETVLDGPLASSPLLLNSDHVPLLRLVGQLALSYLIAEGPDGLYLVDQHAAHERVLFEKYLSMLPGDIPAQTLLHPATVDFPPASSRMLTDQISTLNRLGFHVDEFGPNTFIVRAIPALLSGLDPASALRVLVEEFEEDEAPLQSQLEARMIARICKRAAVKGGQSLSNQEQQALLADLEKCVSPRTCPHGRPTMIHLSVSTLERQFGRRGPR